MSHVQAAILCDIYNKLLTRRFEIFLPFSEYCREKEDEKKHHGAVDQSSLEQQFHKSDVITFVV